MADVLLAFLFILAVLNLISSLILKSTKTKRPHYLWIVLSLFACAIVYLLIRAFLVVK